MHTFNNSTLLFLSISKKYYKIQNKQGMFPMVFLAQEIHLEMFSNRNFSFKYLSRNVSCGLFDKETNFVQTLSQFS